MSDITFEPELNQPPPRAVRYRDGLNVGCGLWAPRLLILPHTIVGIGALSVALYFTALFIAVGLFGADYEGKITKKDDSRAVKGTKYYYAKYEYTVVDQQHNAEVEVSAERYAEINEGDAITVRALEFAPESGQWPRVPGHWPIKDLGAKLFFALFWNGVVSIFLWHLYVPYWRQWLLVRHGVPTSGIIRKITVQRSKGSQSYRIDYEYAAIPVDDCLSKTFQGKTTSRVKGVEFANVGDLITVLYRPNKPHRSVAYRYSTYRADL
jgi:hypothetical protein